MWEKVWRWADVREDVKMSRCEGEQMWEKMWEKMWRWADVKMSRCERRCERRYEDEQMWEKMWEKMWRWADVKMSRCEDEKMWRWEDVKMSRCEDEQMWRWEGVREGVKMRRCEDEKVWEKVWRGEGLKMWRCEDEKMRYRPPLLEEPCAQTLSGKKEKHKRRKFRKSALQPWCRHSNTIYDVQLQKTIVYACSRGNKQLCCSHYNAISRYWNAKHNRTTRNGVRNCSSKTGSRRQRKKKTTIAKHFLKRFLKGKSPAQKKRKSAHKSLSQPWCSHSNTIHESQPKDIVLRMQPRQQATLTQPLQCDIEILNCKTQ